MTTSVDSIRCPGCMNKVLQKGDNGTLKLRPKGQVHFADGACYLECFYCKRNLELPVTLKKSETKPKAHVCLTVPASS